MKLPLLSLVLVGLVSANAAHAYIGDQAIKEASSDRIYLLYGGDKMCWVYDMGQLGALHNGTFNGVDYYSREYIREGRYYTGTCNYNSGDIYRLKSETAVYLFTDATHYCQFRSMAQLASYGYVKSDIIVINQTSAYADFDIDGSKRRWSDMTGIEDYISYDLVYGKSWGVLRSTKKNTFDGYCD